jgi:hypothetical protein
MGLSVGQIEALFRVLLADPPADPAPPPPSRATVGRWVRAAALKAARVLAAVDRAAAPLVRVLCLDEVFFHRRPVLVGVDPVSLAVALCRRSADRTASTWLAAARPFAGLELAVADAGTGLQAGLRALAAERAVGGQGPPLSVGLDVFHIERDARRLLAARWRRLEKGWLRAERLEAGAKGTRGRAAAAAAWAEVAAEWARYEGYAAAWARAKAAARRFRPDGRLNDREWAEAEIRAACAAMPGPKWASVRGQLQDRRTLAFLDRLHRGLAAAEPRAEAREALAELWRLEREGGPGAVYQAVAQCQVCAARAADWRAAYRRVSAALEEAVAASSAVECVNSVLRMQQGRHRNLTPELLDLKRLYWNCRPLRAGRRRGRCPYEHLGLRLATYSFWELLNRAPAELAEELSTQRHGA